MLPLSNISVQVQRKQSGVPGVRHDSLNNLARLTFSSVDQRCLMSRADPGPSVFREHFFDEKADLPTFGLRRDHERSAPTTTAPFV